MPIVHVAPSTDAKEHQLTIDGTCWCQPTAQRESDNAVTYIHQPTHAVVVGHDLNIKKIVLDLSGKVLSSLDPR